MVLDSHMLPTQRNRTARTAQVETHRVRGVEAQPRGRSHQVVLSEAPSPAAPQVGNATLRHPLVRVGASQSQSQEHNKGDARVGTCAHICTKVPNVHGVGNRQR